MHAGGSWSGPTAGEEVLTLDGPWRFTTEAALAADKTGARPEAWDTLPVPGNWDLHPSYATHKGRGWYQREFTVPAEWPKDRRLRLRFEAVYHDAVVTLNGYPIGSHTGGYTPFEFDVTESVLRGAPNVLTVRADNTYRRGAWWAWGGISRSVSLRANRDTRIVYQHIRAEPNLADGSARVFVTCRLENSGVRGVKARLSPVIRALGIVRDAPADSDGKALRAPDPIDVEVPAGSTVDAAMTVELAASLVDLWHFDHPHLYASETTLTVEGEVIHARRDRFGIRAVAVKKDGLYLNGERIRVPGFNRVSDSNETGNTEPDSLVRADVDLMKESGAVFSRLMHSPQAPNLLDYMDERGLMTIAEIPVWGEGDPQVFSHNPVTVQWLREMIERDYNHACIVGWSPGNEIVKHYDYVRTMNDTIRRELDAHRLVAYVSYTAFRGGVSPENDGVTHSDLSLINIYAGKGQDYLNMIRTVRGRWPDKPVFLSEFGVSQIGARPDSRVPNFPEIWEAMGREPYVIGGSLWTFNDYRSDYHGTPKSGNREWGVVGVDRKPKAAYDEVRRAFAPVRGLLIQGSTVTLIPRGEGELPSYTLKGYTLRWKGRAPEGQDSPSGEVKVPELRPGAKPFEFTVPVADLASVTLFSPLGYRMLEATPAP